ncbi:MAG: pyruvate kinase [Bacteroidetes bacterium]|nr:MAG: pyruvate kinase [Bacteroidota bacterium]
MHKVNHQSTKILATIGPVSSSYKNLLALVKAGVDVFRLNFSHGTHEEHQKVIDHIVAINKKHRCHTGILCDLQGPKLRIGKIGKGTVTLKDGEDILFTTKPCVGNENKVYLNYKKFITDIKPGERVLIDDGSLVLSVKKIVDENCAILKIIHGGPLSSNKGVNLPDSKVSLPCLTKKDHRDLRFILTQPVNWIALSFVRSGADIDKLKKIITAANHPAKIIAKIEKPEAVADINRIIKKSNGIMVARGDLGVEVPMEQLPGIQKQIIQKCIQRARPVIVATQMMNSMIENPSPTRAEVTDVANAVLDGADAVMLSGETSIGKYPIEVVMAMNKIIGEAEKNYELSGKRPKASYKSRTFFSDVVCFSAAKTADEINAKAIIGMTKSGFTAFKLSSYRPKSRIYIFSDERHMLATLNMVWGVQCFYYDKFTTTDETIEDVVKILKKLGRIVKGDVIINTGSMPLHKRYRTNMLKITIVE